MYSEASLNVLFTDRAGLRYQRRGIDDDANVANFVETEAVMQIEVRNGSFISSSWA